VAGVKYMSQVFFLIKFHTKLKLT